MPANYRCTVVCHHAHALFIAYIIIAPGLHTRTLGRTQLPTKPRLADIVSSKAPPLPKEVAEDIIDQNKTRLVRIAIDAARANSVLASALESAFTEALSKAEFNASYKTILHRHRVLTLWVIIIDDVTDDQNVKVVQEHARRLLHAISEDTTATVPSRQQPSVQETIMRQQGCVNVQSSKAFRGTQRSRAMRSQDSRNSTRLEIGMRAASLPRTTPATSTLFVAELRSLANVETVKRKLQPKGLPLGRRHFISLDSGEQPGLDLAKSCILYDFTVPYHPSRAENLATITREIQQLNAPSAEFGDARKSLTRHQKGSVSLLDGT
ncbi:hypothetical protein EDD85DRAFT_790950 [Armillaria nabsnona]|nr:hypothetical protein EDD85DRAFT_790950 [Armillaria nabsnona]